MDEFMKIIKGDNVFSDLLAKIGQKPVKVLKIFTARKPYYNRRC